MTNNDYYPDILHDAWVSNSIPILEKVLLGEQVEYSTYYFGGSLVIDMPDIRTDKSYTSFNVANISELQPGDEWRQQYLISRMYVKAKHQECSFYQLAKSNIEIFENV